MKAPVSQIGLARWRVYLLECDDGSYYCGIAVDIAKRIEQHNEGRGSRYIKGSRAPAKLIEYSGLMEMGQALRFEYRIKRLPKDKKRAALNKGSGK